MNGSRFFGAEDEMDQDAGKRLRHRIVLLLQPFGTLVLAAFQAAQLFYRRPQAMPGAKDCQPFRLPTPPNADPGRCPGLGAVSLSG